MTEPRVNPASSSEGIASHLVSSVRLESLWSCLGGGDLSGRGDNVRGKAFWRKGQHFSVALNLRNRTWYDHAEGQGGGLVHLVMIATGRTQPDAWKYLAELGGVPFAERSPAQRARYRRETEAARAESEKLWDRWAGVYSEVSQYTDLLFQLYHGLRDLYFNGNIDDVEKMVLRNEIPQVWKQFERIRELEQVAFNSLPINIIRLLKKRAA